MLESNLGITDLPIEKVMQTIESFAVICVTRGIIRGELMKKTPSNDESINTFTARVRGKSETYGFVTTLKCNCYCEVIPRLYYTEEVIKVVILAEIADTERQTNVHHSEGNEDMSIKEIVLLIKGTERFSKAYCTSVSQNFQRLSVMKSM